MTLFVLALLVAAPAPQLSYPPSRTVDAKDTWFGQTYQDPYRWIEEMKSPEVEGWFKAQANLTDGMLGRISGRDALAEEWMKLDKLQPARYRDFAYEGGRIFYKKTLGGENVGKLYFREGWTGEEKMLFDPSSVKLATAKAGDVTTLTAQIPSPDGKRVLLGMSAAGAEWSELRVLDVASGQLLPERIYPSWGAYSWTTDGKAFFYDSPKVKDLKSKEVELNHRTRLHVLSARVAEDADLMSNQSHPELKIQPREWPSVYIDESFTGYVIAQAGTVQNEMRVFTAKASGLQRGRTLRWAELCKTDDKLVRGFSFYKDQAYAITYAGAPKYKLVRTSLARPDWKNAETVIAEADDSIQSIVRSKDYLFAVYSNGIVSRIVRLELASGAQTELKLPASGTAFLTCPDAHSNRCIAFTTSWVQPITLWDYDGDKNTFAKSIFNSDVTYPGFDALTAEEVEVRGHDGTMIPLSIIHRKDMKLDGSSSAILEGYGAYSISYQPSFSVMRSLAIHNVVLGWCHVRGGGEKGEAWYKAGFKQTKPNTWKDFISCGEYLTQKGYTSPAKLAGTGTSAGGILITRAITERPDLFGAAVCNVGCANAMRMEFSANGPVNTPEFGTVKNEQEAKWLYEMDGLQHVKPGVKYPAVLGVGGWNDPRVAPWQPGKFVAAMQSASSSGKPVLMKVNYDNGHFTEEKVVTFRNFAGQYAFLLWQTGHPEFQPREN